MSPEWTDVVSTVTGTGAVVLAGVWTYARFMKGRTFTARADVTIQIVGLVRAHGEAFANLRISISNVGNTKLTVPTSGAVVRVFSASVLDLHAMTEDQPRSPWPEHAAASIEVLGSGSEGRVIEPGEVQSDARTARVPSTAIALRADLSVTATRVRRLWRDQHRELIASDAYFEDHVVHDD